MKGGTTFTSIYLQKVVSLPISFFLDAWLFLHQDVANIVNLLFHD
jgi:hypothetical protein